MKVWPFGVALQEEASNRLMLRWLKTVVVNDEEKAPLRRQVAMPLSLFWSCGDAGVCPGRGRVDEFDGGGGVVPGAVLAGFLDLVGVVPGAFDDAGIGAFAAFV
jgi:hypothetical protein